MAGLAGFVAVLAAGELASARYDGRLSATAYILLATVLCIILVGLGWAFYRAMKGINLPVEPQQRDEIGDESAPAKPGP
jgi:hypothetical protein